MEIRERALEDAIERALLEGTIEGLPEGAGVTREPAEPAEYGPGGYHRRQPEEYNRTLCLIPRDVLDFVLATQPRVWARLKEHHGAEVRERFLRRLAGEIERRGALDVLRQGIKDSGCAFQLAYFRPASGLKRSPEPVWVRTADPPQGGPGDFYVRSGPGTVKLSPADAEAYIRTRFRRP